MRLKQQPITLVFFFILATIPLLFGARDPLIQGGYTTLIFFTYGIWAVRNFETIRPYIFNRPSLPVYLLIIFIFITSLPLPLFLLNLLSPVRAESLTIATNLAQLRETVTSLSYYASDTRFYSIYFLGLFFYYLCTTNLLHKTDVKHTALWIIMSVGTFEAVYGLMQAMSPSIGVLWLPSTISAEGCARGTIVYRNQFAAFMNMCWPMTIVLGTLLYHPVISRFQALKNRQKTVSVTDRLSLVFQKAAVPFWAASFMILSIIFSRSRGGIVVMLLLVTFFLVMLPFAKRVKALAASSLLLFIFFYGGMIGFQSVTDRFLAFSQGAQGRFQIWFESLSIVKDHLLTGIGMGTYKFLSIIYLENLSDSVLYDFAHNEYLELTIELGLPVALLFFVWIIWQVLKSGARVMQEGRKVKTFTFYPEDTLVAIGSFCAIVGFLLHGFVDFVWRLPVNALYFVTLVAMLNAALSSGRRDDDKR